MKNMQYPAALSIVALEVADIRKRLLINTSGTALKFAYERLNGVLGQFIIKSPPLRVVHSGSLNGVGGRAWELADGSRTVSELAVLLESEFDAPAGVIERDLLELFSNLADEKLVTQDQAESGGI